MFKILVKFKVKDYGVWKTAFDAGSAPRTAAKIRVADVVRGVDEPNHVFVVFEAPDLALARAHLTDPEIRAKQQNAGFLAPPEMFFGQTGA